MSNEKRVLVLDRYEHKVLRNILLEQRNNLIKEQKMTDSIDEILLKTINAPVKKLFKMRKKDEIKAR